MARLNRVEGDVLISFEDLRRQYWSLRSDQAYKWKYLRFRLTHRGHGRVCNICQWQGREFYNEKEIWNAECPRCHSRARQRLLRLVLGNLGLPKPNARILHVSPKGEGGLTKWFRSLTSSYLSIDKGGVWNTFDDGAAMLEMDLTDLRFPDGSFDLVICSHVLECIVEDHKAIGEIYRVLAPGGAAALQVQIYGAVTSRVDTPTQEDYYHAWRPGLDYFERYKAAGFKVEVHGTADTDHRLLSLTVSQVVPICTKPSA